MRWIPKVVNKNGSKHEDKCQERSQYFSVGLVIVSIKVDQLCCVMWNSSVCGGRLGRIKMLQGEQRFGEINCLHILGKQINCLHIFGKHRGKEQNYEAKK